MKAQKAVYACNAASIDSAISTLTSYFYLRKSGFSQKSLHEPLEGYGGQFFSQQNVKLLLPFLLRACFFCNHTLYVSDFSILLRRVPNRFHYFRRVYLA